MIKPTDQYDRTDQLRLHPAARAIDGEEVGGMRATQLSAGNTIVRPAAKVVDVDERRLGSRQDQGIYCLNCWRAILASTRNAVVPSRAT